MFASCYLMTGENVMLEQSKVWTLAFARRRPIEERTRAAGKW